MYINTQRSWLSQRKVFKIIQLIRTLRSINSCVAGRVKREIIEENIIN